MTTTVVRYRGHYPQDFSWDYRLGWLLFGSRIGCLVGLAGKCFHLNGISQWGKVEGGRNGSTRIKSLTAGPLNRYHIQILSRDGIWTQNVTTNPFFPTNSITHILSISNGRHSSILEKCNDTPAGTDFKVSPVSKRKPTLSITLILFLDTTLTGFSPHPHPYKIHDFGMQGSGRKSAQLAAAGFWLTGARH